MIKVNRSSAARGPRLDTLGRVASGVAHELATPIQFVDHNLDYVQRSLEELSKAAGSPLADSIQDILQAVLDAQAGARTAMEIIGAMRSLHHPGAMSPVTVDLNHELDSALLLTRHRISRLARLRDDRAPLPPVPCHPGLLNQVVLNLILNAADSIERVRRRLERLDTSQGDSAVHPGPGPGQWRCRWRKTASASPEEVPGPGRSSLSSRIEGEGSGHPVRRYIARSIVENGTRGTSGPSGRISDRASTFVVSIRLEAAHRKAVSQKEGAVSKVLVVDRRALSCLGAPASVVLARNAPE